MTVEAKCLDERIVLGVIVANSAVVLLSLVDHSDAEMLERADLACLVFFACELALRVWMGRLRFFKNVWNVVDALIIVTALMPVAAGGIAVLRMARVARLVHLGKHTVHLGGHIGGLRLARLAVGR